MKPSPTAAVGVLLAATAVLLASTSEAGDVIRAVRRVSQAAPAAAYREGEVIVALRAGADWSAVEGDLRKGGARELRRSLTQGRLLVRLQPGIAVPEAVSDFAQLGAVQYAEPNGLVRHSQAVTFTPNDQYYKYQWNLKMMNAERTWGIQKGASSVAVAVLDTGVAYEDYTDPLTGISYKKAPDWGDTVFLPGYDFVNGDTHPNDDEWHGTHVASTIAEATNNGLGVAGLAFGCAILPVKVLDADGSGTFFDVAEGIDFAVNFAQNGQHPVKVINLSLGSEGYSETMKQAIDRAFAQGILVVAAAGNSAKAAVEFPASLPNVVAVGALDARKQLASYSNSGSKLDFVAPGGDCDRDDNNDGLFDCIYQQMPDDRYVDLGQHDRFCYCGLDGTSMATPHVSAAAALLYSQGFTDPAAVRAALQQTAERLGGAPAGGRNDTYGYGLVRPANALPGQGLDNGPEQ